MTGLPTKIVWTMTYSHRPHCVHVQRCHWQPHGLKDGACSLAPPRASISQLEGQRNRAHLCEWTGSPSPRSGHINTLGWYLTTHWHGMTTFPMYTARARGCWESCGVLMVTFPRCAWKESTKLQWDVFTKFRAKLPAGRTDWRAFQLASTLYGGRLRRKFWGPLRKEKRAIMLCHRFWVFPGCSTKTNSCKFELVPARTACFWRNIYELTLEARQARWGQSEQCRSVSFHHPPADARLRKQ